MQGRCGQAAARPTAVFSFTAAKDSVSVRISNPLEMADFHLVEYERLVAVLVMPPVETEMRDANIRRNQIEEPGNEIAQAARKAGG